MKDRLEQFISDHRDQFDLHEPDPNLWQGIESGITSRKLTGRTSRTTGWRTILWRAAAVLIIFAAGYMLQGILQHSNVISERNEEKIIQEIPELQEASMYYTSLIDEKIREIEPLIKDNPELGETLQQDLSELDSVYSELQKDLLDNIANDEVVEAMIQNYVLKIQILEDLLDYMEKTSKNNDDESAAYDI